MRERGLGGFVRRSLEILELEHPPAHQRLRAALGRRRVGLVLDGEPFVLTAAGARIRLDPPGSQRPITTVTLVSETVVEILDGELDLLDALRAGRIDVRGAIGELAELWESTRIFLHGLIRCPSTSPLLDALRGEDHDAPSIDLVSTRRENPRDQPDAS